MTVIDHPTKHRGSTSKSTGPKPARAGRVTKPKRTAPTKTKLFTELDGLVDDIERSSSRATWRLADWVAKNTDDPGHGGDRSIKRTRVRLTIQEAAERSGYTDRGLQEMRQAAGLFPPGMRADRSSVRAHMLAYRKHKSVEAACKALRTAPKVSDQAKPADQADQAKPADQADQAKPAGQAAGKSDSESDFEATILLWPSFDLVEAKRLAALRPAGFRLDEHHANHLRERARELREAADLLDEIVKAATA